MAKSVTFAILMALCAAPVFAADDAPPTRRELELTLQAVRATKEKFEARYDLAQAWIAEAKQRIPELARREGALLKAIKLMDDDAKKTKPEQKKDGK